MICLWYMNIKICINQRNSDCWWWGCSNLSYIIMVCYFNNATIGLINKGYENCWMYFNICCNY